MKKSFILSVIFLSVLFLTGGSAYSQLSGIKTIPGDYASITAAIADLNTSGVGSGGVTFNIAAGYTETAGNLVITATGTSANQIVFQKSGSGANPLITANTGTGSLDGIIKLAGADYVTFNGIDLAENTANNTTTMQMEWGYAFLKVDGTNGSQNNTIRNCVITLNRTNTSTYGIYSANHTTAATTSLTVTTRDGANSNNRIFSNVIQNCYSGIWMGGFADGAVPYNFYDNNNQIGTEGGNTIRLFGGTAITTYGIYTIYQDSLQVNNNDIGGGTGGTSTNYGIMISNANNASVTVYNNTVSDTTATTTGITYGIALNNAGLAGTDNTVIVKRNKVHGMTSTASTSGALYGYYIYYTVAQNLYVDSNQFVNNKWGGISQTATGSIYGFYIYPYTTAPITGSNKFITNNYISGNKRTQTIISTGIYYGMYIYYGQSTVNAYNNIIENDSMAVTTSTCYGIYVYNYYAATATYYNNAVRNIARVNGATGLFYGFYISNAAYAGTFNYYNNTVNNITNGFAASTLYGHYISASSVTKNIYGNSAYNLYATMSGAVYGIYQTSGTTTNLYRNSVYNLRASSGAAYGIFVAGGTTNNIYNNYVSDIRSDSSSLALALAGLYLSGGTSNNVYYNTVYLNAQSHMSGNIFGTAALWVSTTSTLDLRNNILVNVSVPGTGGGFTTAYYRNSTTLTSYSNLSNNNDFYAGVPSATRVIYFDGTNQISTLSDYKLFVSPRDANSVTENPPFVNVSTKPYDLHINAAIATQLESNALQISTVTTDADGQSRYPNAGYPVNPSYPPTAPDIGADEIGGIPLDVLGPNIVYTPLNHTQSTAPRTIIATVTDASGVPTTGTGLPVLYWRKNSGAYTGVTATSLGSNQYSFTFGSGVVTGDLVQYYVCAQDNVNPPNVGVFPAAGASGFTTNPPAVSTPPTSPSFYYIAQAGLAGDYTVGINEFNKVTGKNITFQKVINKVMREVIIEEPVQNKEIVKGVNDNIEPETSISSNAKGRKEIREVEEITWIPMENGLEYTGDLYVKKIENPNFPYTSGTEGVYATITAALNDYNIRGVSGATRFLLTDANYSTGETFPLQVNINNDLKPTATNTLTIKPAAGVNATIIGASTGSQIFRILNNNYITIDGSNTLNGTTRNLTIQNTSVSTPQVILVGSTGTTPITNIAVKNCNIINGTNTSSAMVVSDGTTSGTAGYFNNITVQNNSFGLSYISLYTIAVMSTGNGSGLNIVGNDFNTGTSQVRLCRIYAQGIDGLNISNNNMGNDSNTVDASNVSGIWLATGTMNANITDNVINEMRGYGPPRGIAVSSAVSNANINITGNTISGIRTSYSGPPYGIYVFSSTSGVTIRKNIISNLRNFSTGGYGARGINIATTITPANIDITNNFVHDIAATSDASVTYWPIGIALDAFVSTITVYSNSVNIHGSLFGYSSATQSAAFYVGSGITMLNARNNIFVNSFDNTNSTTDKGYAIYSAAANTAYTDINHNDYFISGIQNVLGYLASDRTTIEAWRTATGKDVNSLSGNPLFFNDNNLHIDSTQASPVSNAGVYISTVTDDIDGQTRMNPPDIGADEGNFGPPPPPVHVSPANGSVNISLTPTLDWNDAGGAISYNLQVSADSTFASTLINATSITTSQYTVASGVLSVNTTYYWRTASVNGQGTSQWSSHWNFTTLNPLSAPSLLLPTNGATNVSRGALLDWSDATGALTYRVQVSTNSGFTTLTLNQGGVATSQYQFGANALSPNTQYYWRVKSFSSSDSSGWSGVFSFTTENRVITNLTIIPGGFYNTSTGKLNMKDTVKVVLIDTVGTDRRVDSARAIVDSVNFTAQFSFDNAPSGNYYLYIYHRNHIPISSANMIAVSRTNAISYNFSDAANKTFGSNVIQVSASPLLFGLIPGDANRDEFVDGLDQTIWLQQNGFDGYLSGDFNGDVFVDGLDQTLWVIYNGNGSYLPIILFDDMKVIEKVLQYKREYKEVIDNRKTSNQNNKK